MAGAGCGAEQRTQALDQDGAGPKCWLCHPVGDQHDLEFAFRLFGASVSASGEENTKL